MQNAYDILSDDSKRKAFDQFGPASQQPGFDPNAYSGFGRGGGGGNPFADMFGGGGFGGGRASAGNMGDIFDTLFGGGGGGGRTRAANFPGSDLEAAVTISFAEACRGTNRTIKVSPLVKHATCDGSGLRAGQSRKTCQACGGSGQAAYSVSGFQVMASCTSCGGQGQITPPGALCPGCAGHGKVRESKTVDVQIPAGIEDGMRMKVPGSGDSPIEGSGRPGDLLVRIQVMASKDFRRQGANIYHDTTIPFYTATLGGKIRVPTLESPVDLRVPQGTQPGDEVALKGKGIPKLSSKGSRGDYFIRFRLSIPR